MITVKLIQQIDSVEPLLKEIFLNILTEIDRSRDEAISASRKLHEQIVRDIGQATREMLEAQKQRDWKMSEFADAQKELVQIIRELAEEQKQTKQSIKDLAEETKQSIKELADAQKELADAQKRTETKVGELADAQKRTEQEVAKLSSGLNGVRKQIGGLSKSVAYSLENEAYRKLPGYLKNRFQISMEERLIRTTVGEKEINIFAKARQNGNEVILVGECVLKLDDRSKLGQLEESVEIVKQHYHQPVVPLVITHFAQSDIFRKASEEGIIVVQSFEWD